MLLLLQLGKHNYFLQYFIKVICRQYYSPDVFGLFWTIWKKDKKEIHNPQ